ncbi:hypothetical protein BC567DRAFT_232482 [Phyllosticta citribraziliensis]
MFLCQFFSSLFWCLNLNGRKQCDSSCALAWILAPGSFLHRQASTGRLARCVLESSSPSCSIADSHGNSRAVTGFAAEKTRWWNHSLTSMSNCRGPELTKERVLVGRWRVVES